MAEQIAEGEFMKKQGTALKKREAATAGGAAMKRTAKSGASPIATSAETGVLLLKAHAACQLLGGIHPRSLARLEQRGLIRSVKLLRHKLYAMEDLKALVNELRDWKEAA